MRTLGEQRRKRGERETGVAREEERSNSRSPRSHLEIRKNLTPVLQATKILDIPLTETTRTPDLFIWESRRGTVHARFEVFSRAINYGRMSSRHCFFMGGFLFYLGSYTLQKNK